MNPIRPLAQEHVVVSASPDPARVYCYSPGLCRLPSGRLVATADWGGEGVAAVPGAKAAYQECCGHWQGRIHLSDDHGATWRLVATFPFLHARPFATGGSVYVLGHAGDLMIMRSDDGGQTWSEPVRLSEGQSWHQAPCAAIEANGCIYLSMERRVAFATGWCPSELAPVLMRAPLDADLTRRSSWTFASELPFRQALAAVGAPAGLGVPFQHAPFPQGHETAPGRWCAPIGWLESNVVRVTDPDHVWFDPAGRTLHLLLRAHTAGTGIACLLKVVEEAPGRGAMTTQVERAPSGEAMLWLPLPGGQMKFHVVQDPVTGLYWLLSTQATRSMTRADRLPADHYNLPNNERRRLQLHFSRNLVDWCFAGLVAVGECERASRHYAAMAIDGDDLMVLSRSGDERAASAHNGDLITFHAVRGFRQLAY